VLDGGRHQWEVAQNRRRKSSEHDVVDIAPSVLVLGLDLGVEVELVEPDRVGVEPVADEVGPEVVVDQHGRAPWNVGGDVGHRLLGWLALVLRHRPLEAAAPLWAHHHQAGRHRRDHDEPATRPCDKGQPATDRGTLAELVRYPGDQQGGKRQHGDDVRIRQVAIPEHQDRLDAQRQRDRSKPTDQEGHRDEEDPDEQEPWIMVEPGPHDPVAVTGGVEHTTRGQALEELPFHRPYQADVVRPFE